MVYGFGFVLFRIMFILAFVLVIGMFLVFAVKGIAQWNQNNHSPRLTVPAVIVAKRTNVTRHHHSGAGGHHHHHTSTSYYVTFQFGGGDRMELLVSGSEYGMLVEGDQGDLSFQGTRYLSFVRK
nr:DUF2500 domain-containing protein [uncultured Oscillibacter sp.]